MNARPEEFDRRIVDGTLRSAEVIWSILYRYVRPSSAVHFGCGSGAFLSMLAQCFGVEDYLGIDEAWVDVDEVLIPADRFMVADLSTPLALARTFDIALSLELAECLPESQAADLIRNLTKLAPIVLFSAAIPSQGGVGHLNEQWPEYWCGLFDEAGFRPLDAIRPHVWRNSAVEWRYAQNILLFVDRSLVQHDELLLSIAERTDASQLSIVHPGCYLERVKQYAAPAGRQAVDQRETVDDCPSSDVVVDSAPGLVMTLLVRDEEDIVARNIEHHLSQGVDFVIATDNGSRDGTRAILAQYQDRGKLLLIDEPRQDHTRSRWVNRMAEIAGAHYGAQAIFHCDADEFWVSRTGDLKQVILDAPVEVLIVPVFHVLLNRRDGGETYLRDAQHVVTMPLLSENQIEDSKTTNLYLFARPPKVLFKTSKGILPVMAGNDAVVDSPVTSQPTADVAIVHYPVRGRSQFLQKIVNGGSALEQNRECDEGIGFQWRRWYRSYRDGRIEEEYRLLTVDQLQIEQLHEQGRVQPVKEFLAAFTRCVPSGIPGLTPSE
jgi:hypothetical protein